MKSEIDQALLTEASRLFCDAVLIGRSFNEFPSGIDEPEILHDIMGKQLKDLEKRASALKGRGIEVIFSGAGFMPSTDHEGDTVTIYGQVNSGKGVLSRIYVADRDDIRYVDPDCIHIDDEDLVESNIDLLDSDDLELLAFKDRLRTAPPGLRLFVEFITRQETDVDEPIRGHAVRVPAYAVYNTIDAATLEVIDIDRKEEYTTVGVEDITRGLFRLSSHYRKQIRNKKFRNLSLAKQKAQIEDFLQKSNQVLDLSRFSVLTHPDALFIPKIQTEEDEPAFELCAAEGTSIIGKCLRLDCIEAQFLSRGLPIRRRNGNFNSLVSMCVIVELDETMREALGLSTNVVWLPVTNQLGSMIFLQDPVI